MATELAVASKEGELRLNTYNNPLSNRRCSHCKKRYLRRNVTEVWTTRNEGHRYGWQKDTAKVCMDCSSEQDSEKILGIAAPVYKKTFRVRAA